MTKWLKIGGLVGAAALGVAALGLAVLVWLPWPVSAQLGVQDIPASLGFNQGGGPGFGDGMGFGGPRGFNQGGGPGFGDGMGFGGPRGFNQGGGPGFAGPQGFAPGGGMGLNRAEFLAEALGISVAELQTAREKAHIAAIQQAVAEGLMTQTQADQMLLGGGPGFGGPDRGPGGDGQRGPGFLGGRGPAGAQGSIDREALLAKELGISVEELASAQEKAQLAAIQKAVDEGTITQEQANMMTAQVKLKDYLAPQTIAAKALGITVEELQAARDAGKSLVDLVGDLGLDAATVRLALHTARLEAIQQAVQAGDITQEQADQVLSRPGPGMGRGGPGGGFGPDGGPGRGGPGGGPGRGPGGWFGWQ